MNAALPGGEGVVTSNIGKVPSVIESEDANVISTADLKTIYPAVRRDDPRRLFCIPPNRSHQVQREEAYRSGVREDRDPPAYMVPKDLPQLSGTATEQMTIALALGDDVVYVPIHESVIIFWERLFRFVERESLENTDVAFAKSRSRDDGDSGQLRKRLGSLNGTMKIA